MTTQPYYQDDRVTLYHGDCLELAPLWATDEAVTPRATMVTDPPYAMSYRSGRRRGSSAHAPIAGDTSLDVRDVALAWWSPRPALVFGTWKRPRPKDTRQLIVWDKRGGAGFSGDLGMPWADITEEVYVIGSGWVGGRRPAIYSIPTLPANNRPDHPTPKPVPLMQALLEHCPPGVIVDPFAGSGATLIAARELGRTAVGVEIDERYCEIIAQRLGQQAFDLGGLA